MSDRTILVIDDEILLKSEELLRNKLNKVITLMKYKHDFVDNGNEGIEKLKKDQETKNIQAVILDNQFPSSELQGGEILDQIIIERPDVKVFFLSNMNASEKRDDIDLHPTWQRALSRGALDYRKKMDFRNEKPQTIANKLLSFINPPTYKLKLMPDTRTMIITDENDNPALPPYIFKPVSDTWAEDIADPKKVNFPISEHDFLFKLIYKAAKSNDKMVELSAVFPHQIDTAYKAGFTVKGACIWSVPQELNKLFTLINNLSIKKEGYENRLNSLIVQFAKDPRDYSTFHNLTLFLDNAGLINDTLSESLTACKVVMEVNKDVNEINDFLGIVERFFEKQAEEEKQKQANQLGKNFKNNPDKYLSAIKRYIKELPLKENAEIKTLYDNVQHCVDNLHQGLTNKIIRILSVNKVRDSFTNDIEKLSDGRISTLLLGSGPGKHKKEESNVFTLSIKDVMPLTGVPISTLEPVRARATAQIEKTPYITREEFDEFKQEILSLISELKNKPSGRKKKL